MNEDVLMAFAAQIAIQDALIERLKNSTKMMQEEIDKIHQNINVKMYEEVSKLD